MRILYFFKTLEKKLRLGFISSSGRNFLGCICVHHRGGGHKKKSYIVDFFRRINSFGYVLKIYKTPFYTSFLGFIVYQNGLSNYILLPDGVAVGFKIYLGSFITSDRLKDFNYLGASLPLYYFNLFSLVSNVELSKFKGGILSRAAGTSLILTSKIDNKILLKSKSGWNFLVSNSYISSFGASSNILHCFNRINKAGKLRSLGIRPTVRGVAMNPCDHPHGGGEGRKSPLASAKSPWGWLTKHTSSKNKLADKVRKETKKIIR